jgi:hypothetical protein
VKTHDRASDPSITTKFYTVEKLGEKQSLTPEGFLLCAEVPVARTGTMIYGPGEVPIAPGRDGIVKISRDEDEVFRPEYLASFVGKPVVDEHPQDDINPENWKDLAIGTVLNPRRGTGFQSDLLIVDFLITTPEGIELVRTGKREVSVGYTADYEETGPGEGRQYNMIANHVALVDAGRCGSRCAIGDNDSQVNLTGDSEMKTKNAKKWYDRALDSLRKAIASKDAEQIEKAMDEAERAKDEAEASEEGSGSTHVHVHTPEVKDSDEELQAHIEKNDKEHQEFRDAIAELNEKVSALTPKQEEGAAADSEAEKALEKGVEDDLMEEAPPGTQDKARKARDSAYLGESFQETVAQAEILVPGIRVPTYDRAANPKVTLDSICKLRRKALDLAYAQPEGRGFIDEVHGKALDLENMTCSAVRSLFRSTVALKKAANNKGSHATGDDAIRNTGAGMGARVSIADINERNRKYYESQNI